MFKVVALLKRREGMSRQEFIDYYEGHHSKIGEKHLTGRATKYIRRYLKPLPHPLETAPDGRPADEQDYDAVMEMWFEDEAQWAEALKIMSAPEEAQEVIEDEERLFQRDRIRLYCVDERESAVQGG